jgi:hypothetical protein
MSDKNTNDLYKRQKREENLEFHKVSLITFIFLEVCRRYAFYVLSQSDDEGFKVQYAKIFMLVVFFTVTSGVVVERENNGLLRTYSKQQNAIWRCVYLPLVFPFLDSTMTPQFVPSWHAKDLSLKRLP